MDIKSYDEVSLVQRLARLERNALIAFATACANHLNPSFQIYAESIGDRGLSERLQNIISIAWDSAAGADIGLAPLGDEAESLVPSDDDDWTREAGFGQHGAAAVAYAIRTAISEEAQEAGWAARQVYEAADFLVLQSSPGLDLNSPGAESVILGSTIVQDALRTLEKFVEQVELNPLNLGLLKAASNESGQRFLEQIRESF